MLLRRVLRAAGFGGDLFMKVKTYDQEIKKEIVFFVKEADTIRTAMEGFLEQVCSDASALIEGLEVHSNTDPNVVLITNADGLNNLAEFKIDQLLEEWPKILEVMDDEEFESEKHIIMDSLVKIEKRISFIRIKIQEFQSESCK